MLLLYYSSTLRTTSKFLPPSYLPANFCAPQLLLLCCPISKLACTLCVPATKSTPVHSAPTPSNRKRNKCNRHPLPGDRSGREWRKETGHGLTSSKRDRIDTCQSDMTDRSCRSWDPCLPEQQKRTNVAEGTPCFSPSLSH